jgi:hypothetical protein
MSIGHATRDTPACRNAYLREAAPAKAGTSACRHGHEKRRFYASCH